MLKINPHVITARENVSDSQLHLEPARRVRAAYNPKPRPWQREEVKPLCKKENSVSITIRLSFKKKGGIPILLGATDIGKSTLATFLINQLCQRGLKVALVNAGIGQSFNFTPTIPIVSY